MDQKEHSNLVRLNNFILIHLFFFEILTEMSAAEYREKLKAQHVRKRDTRQDQQMSMKQKHDLIDRL